MRYIDAFNHFFPKRIYELMLASPAGQKDLGKRMRGIPALYDIDERLRVVDGFPDYSQVICLGMPVDRPADRPRAVRRNGRGSAMTGLPKWSRNIPIISSATLRHCR